MNLKLIVGATILNVVSAYAPHAEQSKEEDSFWESMLDEIKKVPASEGLWIGDLNGYI